MSRIRDLRVERGWTQEELGKKLNVQKAAISKYENGITSPSEDALKKLSVIFGVSIDYLLDNKQNFDSPVYHLTKDETSLLDDYRYLDDENKGFIKTLVSKLTSVTRKAAAL